MSEKKLLPLVPMVPVTSSNVRSVGYDDTGKVLYIQYKGYEPKRGQNKPDTLYKYFYVPERVYLKMLGARSKGKFVSWHIKGRYRYRLVGRRGWRGPVIKKQKEMNVEKTPSPIRRKPKSAVESTKKKQKKKSVTGVKTIGKKKSKSGRRKNTRTRRKTTKTRR